MSNGFMKDTKELLEETVQDLKRIEPGKAPPPAGVPQYFLIVSGKTKFMINERLADAPSMDLDDILMSIYDFVEEQPGLEEGNIYLTKFKSDTILLETLGDSLFAEAFSRDVDRQHYREFHRAVKHLAKRFPQLSVWDGSGEGVPPALRASLRQYFRQRPESAPGEEAPAGPPEPVPPAPLRYEPDIQDCERKMRAWYGKGYRIDRLKEALHKDWATLVRTFEEYERDVERLELLRGRVGALELPGLEDDLDTLRPLLNDPSKVPDIEKGLVALARKAKERLTIRLPVSDPNALAAAIRDLPLGIPSTLWGVSLEALVEELLTSERGLTPDGAVVVRLRGLWYQADPRKKQFLTPFSGLVQGRKDLAEARSGDVELEKLLDDILEGK